jgi:hypothetical protein
MFHSEALSEDVASAGLSDPSLRASARVARVDQGAGREAAWRTPA